MANRRRWEPRLLRASMLLVALAVAGEPAAAQSNGRGTTTPPGPSVGNGGTAADSTAAALARADSVRAQLVQPPGTYGGVRAMDVIRVPFQLFGATLALGAMGAGATYTIVDRFVLRHARKAQGALREFDIHTRVDAHVDAFGPRSWPGIVARYQGLAPFYAEAGYSMRHYQHYEAGVELGGESLGGQVSGRYARLREPHFWGVGADTPERDRSDFSQDVAAGNASAWWAPAAGPVRLSAGLGWEDTRVIGRGWDSSQPNTNELFSAETIYGLDDRMEYLRVDGGAALDLTHVEHLQVRGASLAGKWQYYDGLDGTPSSFHRVAGDARVFVPANKRQLFALRLLAEDRVAESGRGVPMTHLARLGGDEGLRGYEGFRFRDSALLAAQLEWRYEVYWHPGYPTLRLEGFAFADVGAVGPALSAIERSDFHTTPGFGLRYVREGDALAELYLARGGDSWRLGIGFGRTF